MVPETRYARVGNRQVAYQIVGSGPIDVLVGNYTFLPIDLMWTEPTHVRFLERLSSFSRSLWIDTWGGGSSGVHTGFEANITESTVDDMLGALDAVGWERAAVLDLSSSWFGQFFAATHPERTRALVLDGPTARVREAAGYPEGLSEPEAEKRLARIADAWGTGGMLRHLAPSVAGDDRVIEWAARCERIGCTPDEAVARWRGWYDADVRALLPAINVPTLVLVRQGHKTTDQSRYVGRHIDGAKVVELPGPDRAYFAGDTRPMLEAIEEFLTGKLPTYEVDRVLATVVFTDIVGSTEHASRLGDGRWRELLAKHDSMVRGELERFRGREVKSTGDGVLATFDGPGRALRCAAAIRDAVRGLGIEVRIGLHTGEIELQGEDVGGIAVHIAQRVMAEANPGEVVVSSTVKDLVAGSGIVFEDRGMQELRGVSESWRLFSASI